MEGYYRIKQYVKVVISALYLAKINCFRMICIKIVQIPFINISLIVSLYVIGYTLF